MARTLVEWVELARSGGFATAAACFGLVAAAVAQPVEAPPASEPAPAVSAETPIPAESSSADSVEAEPVLALPDTAPVAVMSSLPAIEPFLIAGVPVDASGPNTVAARERGLTQGRVAAYRRLIERLVPSEHIPTVASLSATEIIDLVQEFSVANERSSAVRYLADLTIRFNASAIRALFSRLQVPFAEIPSRPLVVVPVTRLDPTVSATLWGDPDPWLSGWAAAVSNDGLAPLHIPLGDISDINALSADQAFDQDLDALRRFAEARGADGVVLAVVENSFETPGALQVSLAEIRNGGGRVDTTLGALGVGAATVDDALTAAAKASAREIEESWKRRTMLQAGVEGELVAIADVGRLDDWLRLKAKLREVPIVNRVDLQAMTRSRIQLAIGHAGTADQLRSALAVQAIEMTDVEGLWVLTMAGATKIEEPAPETISVAPVSEPPAAVEDAPAQ